MVFEISILKIYWVKQLHKMAKANTIKVLQYTNEIKNDVQGLAS